MSSEHGERAQILQGTLDLIVLRVLASMGPQHAYGVAARLQQVSEDSLNLNQGTLYPALVRLEQQGWIRGAWGRTESNREAKFYSHHPDRRKGAGEGDRALAQALRVGGQAAVGGVLNMRRFILRLVNFFGREARTGRWPAKWPRISRSSRTI